jgi:uncharacterized protein (DUF697 family)
LQTHDPLKSPIIGGMASKTEIRNLLNVIGEVDLRPVRAEAERDVQLIVVSDAIEKAEFLVEQLRRDPEHPEQISFETVPVLSFEDDLASQSFDLAFVLLEVADFQSEAVQVALRAWRAARKRFIVVAPHIMMKDAETPPRVPVESSKTVRALSGDIADPAFVSNYLVPAALALTPGMHLTLARNFPLFRTAVTRQLIMDTSYSNAAYALTTGLAEVIPILNIPLNVADMFVLTKAQAFLVYRLGLALGMPTPWQSYVTEFGGVLGGGFLWRQMTRLLVGLIPVFGILPKVAVSFAGTYVVGKTVYQWYLTDRHLPKGKMSELYRQAFAQGREVARKLLHKRIRLRLPRFRSRGALPAAAARLCPACGKTNQKDALFCQYCGASLQA